MILRCTSEQLRKLADQADAYTAIAAAGGKPPESGTVLEVDGQKIAYLFWWEDKQRYLVEFLNFKPVSEVARDNIER